jgi:hypothetical protein
MTAPAEHSKFSASNFEADSLCPGRRVMQRGLPDRGSKYADEGTAAHTLLGWCIDNGKPALAYLGRRIPVGLKTWEVTTEMATAVQTAVDAIRARTDGSLLMSEQRVNYSRYLGVPFADAWGTSDIIAVQAAEPVLDVDDYKHGMGVEVDAENNSQMKLYALGALEACEDTLGPFTHARLTIHQPRIKSEPSTWTVPIEELKAWGTGEARRSVEEQLAAERLHKEWPLKQWQDVYLRPNEKSCKFCKAKATCPALRDDASKAVFEVVPASPDEFDNLKPAEHAKHSDSAWLAKVLNKADLIEDYLKAVRAEVEARLLDGKQIPGFKLVQGKRGNRKWIDGDQPRGSIVHVLGDAAYKPRELVSPTEAEKLIGKKPFAGFAHLVTQSDGAKHVAPVSDPRPALSLTAPADDFDVVS